MNLIEMIGSNAAQLGGANAFTGVNLFSGGMRYGVQAFTASASGTDTVSAAGGAVVEITGSGSAYTLQLPASPPTGLEIALANKATVPVTLSGNGSNIDSSSTVTLPVAQTATVVYDGAVWISVGTSPWNNLTIGANLTANNRFIRGSQSFSGAGTIVAGNGSYVALTGTSGGTVNLPATPTTGQEFAICDEGGNAGTNAWTIAGNGNNINGAGTFSLNANYKRVAFRYNGTAWFGG